MRCIHDGGAHCQYLIAFDRQDQHRQAAPSLVVFSPSYTHAPLSTHTHTHTSVHTHPHTDIGLGSHAAFAPSASDTVTINTSPAVPVPHELPGQDPEGGSEVNFAMGADGESSETTATPRADSDYNRRTSDTNNTFADGRPSLDGPPRLGAPADHCGAGAAAGGPAPPGTPGGVTPSATAGNSSSSSNAIPVPDVANRAVPAADGLGGSWQDLQVLRAQSMAARSASTLHHSHVS